MPSTAVMCCRSSVRGVGAVGAVVGAAADAGVGVDAGADVEVEVEVEGTATASGLDGVDSLGGVSDCDKGDGPGRARPDVFAR
jgi:hypothetical protein